MDLDNVDRFGRKSPSTFDSVNSKLVKATQHVIQIYRFKYIRVYGFIDLSWAASQGGGNHRRGARALAKN